MDWEARDSRVRPWLEEHAETFLRFRREKAVDRIYMPRRPLHGVPSGAKGELYDFVAGTIGDVPVLYLEFGVFSGRSMIEMTKRFAHPGSRFFGFDSFEGLPEDWKDMPQGTFTTRGRIPVMSDPRVKFVKGWFQNTLPGFLDEMDFDPKQPVLVHYDADLYSSTLFILSMLWNRIPDYYFIFDEFMSEEIVAMDDFAAAFPVELKFFSQTNVDRFPPQIFGHLQRVALDLSKTGA